MPMGVTEIQTEGVRDLAPEVLDGQGRLRLLPAAYWTTTTWQERALFGNRHGLYSFPTVELVERLREIIAGRTAIEIGAGHGVLAEALDIPATDSRHQEAPTTRLYYELNGQTIVPYGPNVIQCEASAAVRRFKPQVVVACWVTQKWDARQPNADSSVYGVDEFDVLRNCQTYVFVGCERVHREKRIWVRPHTIEYPSFVYSRAHGGTRDFIATWKGVPVSRRTKPKKKRR